MKSDYDMSRVHQANLTILKEIDRICRKYNIKYMLDAGTLIGAVRHKGFIPWDDDADVAFTRNQYDAFMKVVKRELPQGLFVIDRLPAGRMGASITKLLHMAVYGMAMGHRYELDFKKYSLANKIFVGILAGVGRCVPMKAIFSMQRALALKDRKSKGRLRYYSNYQPDFLYVTVDQDWCDNVEDAPFEDTQLMIPKGWHEVLTLLYGDYMQLPPEEQRVPAHSSMEIEVFD